MLLVNAEKTVGAEINDAETKTAEVQKTLDQKRFSKLTCVLLTKEQNDEWLVCLVMSFRPPELPKCIFMDPNLS